MKARFRSTTPHLVFICAFIVFIALFGASAQMLAIPATWLSPFGWASAFIAALVRLILALRTGPLTYPGILIPTSLVATIVAFATLALLRVIATKNGHDMGWMLAAQGIGQTTLALGLAQILLPSLVALCLLRWIWIPHASNMPRVRQNP